MFTFNTVLAAMVFAFVNLIQFSIAESVFITNAAGEVQIMDSS